MKENRMKQILESIAQHNVSDDVNLWPRIAESVERKSFMQSIRTRPALALVFVLLALALLSGVAYAIGKVTGYIPGIGLVDQSAPLRALAEPVSVTRDGITLTIEQLILSIDKTVMVYKVDGIPKDAFTPWKESPGSVSVVAVEGTGTPGDQPVTSEDTGCDESPYLLLPDGTKLDISNGEGNGWETGYENRFVYGPASSDIDQITFYMPCISGTLLGRLPENWKVTLQLVPASPAMTIIPVVEVTVPPAVVSKEAMTLEKVIETDESYILIGRFRSIGLPLNAQAQGLSNWVQIIDNNGQPVEASTFNNLEPTREFGEFLWGYEIKRKEYAWPLTLTIGAVSAIFDGTQTEFEFDTGPNPQVGQKWVLNQDVRLAGYTIRVVSIERTSSGYSFLFQSDPSVTSVTPDIKGFPYTSSNGGSDGSGHGEVFFNLDYSGEVPSGKLTVDLGWLIANIAGPWQIQWSPETASAPPYDISVHVDQFIPIEDGYYLIGHTEWADEHIQSANPGAWAFKAYDATGREVPIEPAIFENDIVRDDLQPNQWAYHLYGKNFNGPVTLRVSQMGVEFREPIRFTLDLRSQGFNFSDSDLGKTWELESTPLGVPGISASVSDVTYMQQGDLRGFQFVLKADNPLQSLGFTVEKGLITDGIISMASSGGSTRNPETGILTSTILYNAKMQFPLVLRADHGTVSGSWETTWTPPADTSGSEPVFVEQACLDLPRWKQISASEPIPVPAELRAMSAAANVFLPEGSSLPSPDQQWIAFVDKVKGRMGPGLYISRVDGSGRRLLAQLDYWLVLNDLSWSQDSEWVGFSILNMDLPDQGIHPYITVNIHSCNVIPLLKQ